MVQLLSPQHEQRKSVRYSRIMRASLGAASQNFDPPLLARILNISTGGVGIHVGVRFEVGTLLLLSMRCNSGKHRLQAQVAHVTEQINGTWIVGAAFTEELSSEELLLLLTPPPLSSDFSG